jgi:phage baseplate assembly protein W
MDPIPHLSLPLRISEGAYASVQQDTLDELVCCVQAICSFPIGSRIEAPEFGIPEFEHSDRPLPTQQLEAIVEQWEPRANVEISEGDYDATDPLATSLRVQVTSPGAEEGA